MTEWRSVHSAPRKEVVKIRGYNEISPDRARFAEGIGQLSNIGWVTDLEVDVITGWKPLPPLWNRAMSPVELFDTCMDAIDRFNKGEVLADEPFVFLVIPKDRCPTGDSVTLYGRSGPRGRIATVKEVDGRFEVAAYFPAVPIVKMIGEAMGTKVKVRRI